MKKFAIRSDMEGLYGVTTWDEVIPGRVPYQAALENLHRELGTLVEGLLGAGANEVEIYDEHYYGLNIDVTRMPQGVSVIRGKPPYRKDWAGAVDDSFSGMILQGYHAMAGTAEGILPHTYEPDIRAIWINGKLVGETGVEAAIAGEAGVPLVLFVGDQHGAKEARELVPGVECVIVKEGMGEQKGKCRSWADVSADLHAAARKIVQNPPSSRPLVFEPPVEMKVQLNEGKYRDLLSQSHPQLFEKSDQLSLTGPSVLSVWAEYWRLKDEALVKLA